MKPVMVFLLICTIPLTLTAQRKWENVSSRFGSLPASVKVYLSTDSLNGRAFRAYYVEADLKDRKLEFTTETGGGKRYTPSQYDSIYGPSYLVMNGTFFSFQTNQNLNVVIRNGKMEAYNVPALKSQAPDSFYYPTRSAIGISRSRKADVAWLFTDTAEAYPYAFQDSPILAKGINPDPSFRDLQTNDQWKFWRMKTAIGGGPVLVKNGKKFITNREEQMFPTGLNDLHPRTAMGYTKNRKLILLVVEGRSKGVAEGISLDEMAELFVELKCVEALNLDGGGSSCLLVNGKETIRPSDRQGQRAVPAVFMIRKK